MEIAQQLLKFKYHILAGLTVAAVLCSLIIVAPSFLSILTYFWPLLLSTVLFLLAGVFFGKTSSPLGSGSGSDSASEMSGEDFLNYVAAGQPELASDT